MKTHEEILERFKSHETIDVFNVQKTLLLSLLPFELAKDHLNSNYIESYDDLPEDEKWVENLNPKEQLISFLPLMNKIISQDNFVEIRKGLLLLKTYVWVVDEDFYKEIEHYFSALTLEDIDEMLLKVNKHFGYTPIIEDIPFEEIPE